MIFVTVGTQLAFDRLVDVVDRWAGETGNEVFAQIGPTTRKYEHLGYAEFLQPAEFDRHFTQARFVVAHAGMGSILSALSFGKPIIIMPRRAVLGEHRNEHQMATARRFAEHPAIRVAWDEVALLDMLIRHEECLAEKNAQISDAAPEDFLNRLRAIIDE